MKEAFARVYLCDAPLNPDEVKKKFLAANEGGLVQASKPDPTDNELYFEMLAAQTLRADSLGCLLARKPEIDFLLRLAGTTQISEAIKKKGARPGEIFVLTVAGRSEPKRPPGVPARRLPRRELSKVELERIERAALLNAERPR